MQKTGCFFGQKSFSTQLSLFSLDFFLTPLSGCMTRRPVSIGGSGGQGPAEMPGAG
jgi:hypothetical protein